MCPLWKHRFQEDEEVIVSEIGETTIKKLVDKFYHLTAQKKEIEENLQGIKEFLEQYVASHADEEWKKLYGEE
jgi:truncated hemoglobin YjbI